MLYRVQCNAMQGIIHTKRTHGARYPFAFVSPISRDLSYVADAQPIISFPFLYLGRSLSDASYKEICVINYVQKLLSTAQTRYLSFSYLLTKQKMTENIITRKAHSNTRTIYLIIAAIADRKHDIAIH